MGGGKSIWEEGTAVAKLRGSTCVRFHSRAMSREGEPETQRWVGGCLEAAGMGTGCSAGAGSPFGVMNMLGKHGRGRQEGHRKRCEDATPLAWRVEGGAPIPGKPEASRS